MECPTIKQLVSGYGNGKKELAQHLPAAIASSRISLNRCESSLGSEQSIEQKSLWRKEYKWLIWKSLKQREAHLLIVPVHISLAVLVQVNQIILLRIRSSIVCFKLFNICLSNLPPIPVLICHLSSLKVQRQIITRNQKFSHYNVKWHDLFVHGSEKLMQILNNFTSKVLTKRKERKKRRTLSILMDTFVPSNATKEELTT